jgi:hypothetical protein
MIPADLTSNLGEFNLDVGTFEKSSGEIRLNKLRAGVDVQPSPEATAWRAIKSHNLV